MMSFLRNQVETIEIDFPEIVDITPEDFPGLKDWYRNCISGGLVAPVTYQHYWQSKFYELPICAMQGLQSGNTPQTIIFGNSDTPGTPKTASLDGYSVWLCDAAASVGGLTSSPSLVPQSPLPNAAEPEVTIFCIVGFDQSTPGFGQNCIRMRGGDANSDIALGTGGTLTDMLSFFVRSSNGSYANPIDTVSIEADGNYHLVCLQYSHATKTARLIVDGRITSATNLAMNTFNFVTANPAGFLLNSNDISTAKWRGKTGEMCFYDGTLLTDQEINNLANNYYLKKYPSLIWIDIPGGGVALETITHKYISKDLPIEIINDYYGYRPYLKTVDDMAAEIKDKDTITRRLKISLVDDLEYKAAGSLQMASYWRMWIASHKNFKGKLIRYYRRLGDDPLALRFTGLIDEIKIANNGTVTIEAVDLLKAMSKVDYPILSGLIVSPNDTPGIWTVASESEMLALSDAISGDYCKQTFFYNSFGWGFIGSSGGSLTPGDQHWFNIAFYKDGNPIDLTGASFIVLAAGQTRITLSFGGIGYVWDYVKIFWGKSDNQTPFEIAQINYPTMSYIFDDDTLTFPAAVIPTEAIRYYKLADPGVYSNSDDWDLQVGTPDFPINIDGDASLLDDSGFIKIDDEIIHYGHITTDSDGQSLTDVERGVFATESPRHKANTAIYYILCVTDAINIFAEMKHLLYLAGITSDYLSAKFDEYILDDDLDVTCLPIIKDSNLADIFFDLVNLADALCFQNEDGLIDIIKINEHPVDYVEISDEANIIFNTSNLDLNDKSRLTRWILYWNRFDIDKGLRDYSAYGRGNITVDDVAETFYGDKIQDIQYTAWLNAADSDTAAINAAIYYANKLLDSRRYRTNQAQLILSCEFEIKDDEIKLAQIVKIRTSKVLNELGESELLKYRVILKEPSDNKIKFKFQMINETPIEES